MNPILSREIRARFRDARSFWLLFGVSALLGLAATLIYADATSLADTSSFSGRARVVQIENYTGRELFRLLALGNTFAWLLIAPALTATGLARERERGLLESLWLSPFRVRAQIWGRLGAALCFLAILQVAALPVYGIAVLLGGVSLPEIGLSGLIIALGALTGAAFGLFCSSRSYRGPGALAAALFGTVAWSVAAFFCGLQLVWFPTTLSFLGAFTHPVALLWLLLSPNDFAAPRLGAATTLSMSEALRYGLGFQILFSLGLLWAATRLASKPLPDRRWSEGNPRFKKWRAALEATKNERQARREAARARETVAGALLYEVPVEKWVRFKDPLLAREVRGRFRLRESGILTSLARGAILVLAIAFWLGIAFIVSDPVTRANAGMLLILGNWAFGCLAIGVMSSGALVREREAGTWESLHLSLLSPREIVRAKWLSPLATFGYWSAPFWILLPLCFSFEALGALVIAVASLASVSAWGLWISSRAPHLAAATSWTLGTLLLALVARRALDDILGIRSGLGLFFHPAIAIQNLFDNPIVSFSTKLWIVGLNVFLNALLTAGLLAQVCRRLKKTEL